MPRFAIVVAADDAGGIGKGGTLAWRLPGDLAHFKRLTRGAPAPGTQNAVVMGRVTWESIPEAFRPLPGRLNVVLSANPALPLPAGVLRAGGLAEALARLADTPGVGAVFVIGGGDVYRLAIAHPDLEAIHLTRVQGTFGCDTFFPPMPPDMTCVSESAAQVEGGLVYRFSTWQRALNYNRRIS